MVNTRYIVRHVNHFRTLKGHELALVFASEVKDIRSDDRDWYQQLERPDFVGIIHKGPGSKTKTRFERLMQPWSGMAPLPSGKDGVSYVPSQDSKEEAAEAVRAQVKEIQAEADREASDPLYALEKALKAHDWYAHYSDDYGVCRASDLHWEKIQGLLKLVPEDEGQALVAKYKPAS